MKTCTQCQTDLPENARYCPNCGEPVPATTRIEIHQDVGQSSGQVTALHADAIYGDVIFSKTEAEELREALSDSVKKLRNNLQRRIRQAFRTRPDEPYRYLDYFDIEHIAVFFGRDAARKTLLDQIRAERYESRLTLLHAPSGAGKTSLLRAGTVPDLFDAGDLPVYIHHPREPVATIKQAILPAAPHPEKLATLPLLTFLTRAAEHLEQGERLVILLDQFEEFFIHLTELQKQPFIQGLADCYTARELPVKFVLAMRKDYFSDMAGFADEIEKVFLNQYLLPAFTREEATEAITAPLESTGMAWESGAVETLLSYLAQGEIEPPHLQLICSRLHEAAKESGQAEISVEGVDLRSIHADYLNEVMSRAPDFTSAQVELGWKVLKRLVTSRGTKRSLPLNRLHDLAPKDELDSVLERLVNRRLLRQDEGDGEALVEVSHDTLAEEIAAFETDQERRQKVARELVERGVATWKEHEVLMDAPTLRVLDEYRDDLADPGQEGLELLFRSAIAADHEPEYWAERARQGGVDVDEIELSLSRLRQFIMRYFNLEETRTLCFRLRLDYDDLSGAGRQEKVHSLVNNIMRHGQQIELLEALRQSRPNAFLQDDLEGLPLDLGESSFPESADGTTYLFDLHRFIENSYNLDELRDLCFDLRIDFEDLPGQTRSAKARELVRYVVRYDLMEPFLDELRRTRPIPFEAAGLHERHMEALSERRPEAFFREGSDSVSLDARDEPARGEDDAAAVTARLHQFMRNHYNVSELKDLCFDLDIRYEDLPGESKAAKALELVLWMERHARLNELLLMLKRTRPAPFQRAGLDAVL